MVDQLALERHPKDPERHPKDPKSRQRVLALYH